MSGTPLSVIQGTAYNPNAAGSSQVPDLVNDSVESHPHNFINKPPSGADPNRYQHFDRSAHQVVNLPADQPQRFGTARQNGVRGLDLWNLYTGLFRTVNPLMSVKRQFRLEVLNALNRPNYANPRSNSSNAAAFGSITLTTSVGERDVRLGFRIRF